MHSFASLGELPSFLSIAATLRTVSCKLYQGIGIMGNTYT